ncbi:hypothetical protein LTR62_001808 [Meristemomyces frigidus]|uniref:EthD domain-containing protein n=1 Tax=Meristemomyces frigidus TaxID=1508187 RepID=A0AAN7TG26_9PEZI|nr:hypothetical protein LTR62_001808 [Meristemomyces frigidus]
MVALIYVSYPFVDGAKFDMDYYLNTHMRIVEKHWSPYGMKDWTVVQFQKDDPSGQNVQAVMTWDSVEAFDKAIAANIPEVMEDVKHYSPDVMPVRYYAQVMAKG